MIGYLPARPPRATTRNHPLRILAQERTSINRDTRHTLFMAMTHRHHFHRRTDLNLIDKDRTILSSRLTSTIT